MSSLCWRCLYDTRNGIYEPDIDPMGNRFDGCALNNGTWPNARHCNQFEESEIDPDSVEGGGD